KRAIMADSSGYLSLLVANDYVPPPHFPSFDKTVDHVGIFARKSLGNGLVIRTEHNQRAVRRIGERARKNHFAARMGFARQAEMLITKRRSPRYKILNHFVEQ